VITAPTAGATVSGITQVTGNASDNVQVVAVAVSIDSGPWSVATGTTAWSFTFDASRLNPGSHIVTVRATDSSGNSKLASVGVTVQASPDTTPPTVSISAPITGSTVGGTITVKGSASDSNSAVAEVQVSVDGGAYQPAAGTSSWSIGVATSGYANGSHSLSARAIDAAGNSSSTTDTVTFMNTVADTTPPTVAISVPAAGATVSGTVTVAGTASDNVALAKVELSVDGGAYQTAAGTSSWSFSLATGSLSDGAHTLTVRATDSSGNQATTSESVTTSNAPPSSGQTLVTPEGATIQVAPDVSGWTAAQVYDLLKANAYELNLLGPDLTVDVQTQYASETSTAVSGSAGAYSNYQAIVYLQATPGSSFTGEPDAIIAHEYGVAWSLYHLYLSQGGDWTGWLQARGLLGDPRLDSNYMWDKTEMIAEDYRLLFGSSAAQSEMTQMNYQIPDARTVPGLKTFFTTTWAN
jgi:hypothetical protein